MKNSAEKVSKLLIGEKVNRLRNTHALTKEKLAEKAEVDVKTIHRLEKGKGASPDTLQRVAEALGVPVTELTIFNLDYGSLIHRSLQELSNIKSSLYELLENKKIYSDEHHEMRTLIETVEKQKMKFSLPPLPPPPEGKGDLSQNDPMQPLEKLDLGGAIIRVLKETKPWVKYAPDDKNNPTLAHRLHDCAFIQQPYFCDLGQWRLGLFPFRSFDLYVNFAYFCGSHLRFNTELRTLFRSVKRKRALLRSNSPGITEPTEIGGKRFEQQDASRFSFSPIFVVMPKKPDNVPLLHVIPFFSAMPLARIT